MSEDTAISTEVLEDHFFGSGAFSFGWLYATSNHFPVRVVEIDPYLREAGVTKVITKEMFVQGIRDYANITERDFESLLEDMDAVDVDTIIQTLVFGAVVYG